jgi:hypothetical protein
MADVIDLPLVRECHCGAKLRPATRAEIQADHGTTTSPNTQPKAATIGNHQTIGPPGKNTILQILRGCCAATPAVPGSFGLVVSKSNFRQSGPIKRWPHQD